MILVSVSVVNNFFHPQTASDYEYLTFGELARFIYCVLQKIKQGTSLPLVKQWDEYVLANHSKLPSIADGQFLAGTRVLAALNKFGSSCLTKEFQQDALRFLEKFTNCVLSTVAARSKIGQGLSCFCPSIIIGVDDHAPLHLLGLFSDGFLERGLIKGSDIEACRAEYQSFVQEQRQLERSSTRSRPGVGEVLSFCSAQAGFRARQQLFKVCIVTKNGRALWLLKPEVNRSIFPGVSTKNFCCARTSDFWRENHHQSGSRDELWRWSAWCSALRAGFRDKSALHPEKLFLWLYHRNVGWVRGNLWQHHKQWCFWTVEPRGDCISFTGGGWGLCLRESGCGSAKGSQGLTRTVVGGRWHQAIVKRFNVSVWC